MSIVFRRAVRTRDTTGKKMPLPSFRAAGAGKNTKPSELLLQGPAATQACTKPDEGKAAKDQG